VPETIIVCCAGAGSSEIQRIIITTILFVAGDELNDEGILPFGLRCGAKKERTV
jgi:hypothetical protein